MGSIGRQCIFCDNKADSREHIWSDWILRILPETTDGKLTRRFEDGSMKTWSTSKPVLTLGKVCEKNCNNGWMNAKLEGPMKAATENIIIRNTSKVFSNAELTVISAWAFKTTILANHSSDAAPFFS